MDSIKEDMSIANNRPLYNVNEYTDVELYDILDLVNPSDRELEAKILMQIHKYENIGTKSAQKLARFFDDIYNHFFETEEDDDTEVEGFENTDDVNADSGSNAPNAEVNSNVASANNAPVPTNSIVSMGEKSEAEENIIGYTQSLEYSKGKLNPLLQQTTKRIISIDSQYRSDKRTLSTAFTFNLSEPLKDVVSLKLYSIQIPYTWYTIGKAYGNNFFFLKGRAPGIDSGSGLHDIEILIAPGNYSPAELIGAVNNSIFAIKTAATDISMGDTRLTYNSNTSLSTAFIDLKKGYNQSSYILKFDSRTIPDYLGFIDNEYSTRTLRSRMNNYNPEQAFILTENNNYFTINIYQNDGVTFVSHVDIIIESGSYTRESLVTKVKSVLNVNNQLTNTDCYLSNDNTYIDLKLQLSRLTNRIDANTITEIVFYDRQIYNVDFTDTIFSNAGKIITGTIGNNISEVFDLSFDVPITPTTPITILRGQLLCKIITTFSNGAASIEHNIISTFDEITYDSPVEVFVLLRNIINNYKHNGVPIFEGTTIINNQMTLKIKKDDRIWTNELDINGNIIIESCFGFDRNINILNEITGELPAQEQSGRYTISTEPFVYFTPNIVAFRENLNGINDISFSVPPSIEDGNYNLDQYLSVINQSIRDYSFSHNNIFNVPADESYIFDHTTAYPDGTYAYLQNEVFQLNVEINKVFDESMYTIDFTGSIFDKDSGNMIITFSPTNIVNDLSLEYAAITTANNVIINKDTIIFTLLPKINNPPLNGNENDEPLILTIGSILDKFRDPVLTQNFTNDSESVIGRQLDDIINDFIQPVFDNYADPISNVNIFKDSTINAIILPGGNGFAVTLKLVINKRLVAKNYRISFNDTTTSANTWNANLKISPTLLNNLFIDTSFNMRDEQPFTIYDSSGNSYEINNNQIDNSGNILDIDGNILNNNGIIVDVNNTQQLLNGRVIYKVIPYDGNVLISGVNTLPSLVPLIITPLNNTFRFVAIEDGVATITALNDVIITIPSGEYYRDTLVSEINARIRSVNTSTKTLGTSLSIINEYGEYYTRIISALKREYVTTDYNLVFYDKASFATCSVGVSSVQNTTWDTTIGWIMGFREYTIYDLSVEAAEYAFGTVEETVVDSADGNVLTIIGDTGLSTNLYNYFLLCLDDFNQNHLNDGLVTITNVDTSIALPSYASRADFVCDPTTGQKVYNVTTGLTEKQIYAAQAIANSSVNTDSIGTSVSTKSYGTGPFVSDVFGLIPIKVAGLANGSSYVEFGGTLQNQERSYFGPVNIHRMSVRLVTDRGNLVDLNRANWSFSLICEQLNKLDPSSGSK